MQIHLSSMLAGFLLATTTSASAVLPRTTPPPCVPGVYVVVAPGTFEYLEGNGTFGFQKPVVDAILRKIPGSEATVVIYPESTDVKTSVPIGVAATQKLLTDYYHACPRSRTVLVGYSQGAIVTGSALAGGPAYVPVFGSTGTGPPALDRAIGENVVAIVQFGDLNRVEGIGADADVSDKPCKIDSPYPRNGTARANWAYYDDKISEFCADSDGACCNGQLNLFAHIGYFTTANIEAAANFVQGKFNGTL